MAKAVSEATLERARLLVMGGGEYSSRQIEAAMNLSRSTASSVMTILRRRKHIYIARFDVIDNNPRLRAVYRYGKERDAKYPKVSRKRNYLREERVWLETSRASGSLVFRHPQDVALYGEYQGRAA